MSAIASFYVIDGTTAAEIASADGPERAYAVLVSDGLRLDGEMFPWSGYCLLELLDYLEERGLPVFGAGHQDVLSAVPGAVTVLARDQSLQARLDPAAFAVDELAESMSEFEFDADEAVRAAIDGLNSLSIGLGTLAEDQLLVVVIG